MRVLFVSDEGTGGGAAIAATRLAQALRRKGVFVHRLFRHGEAPPADSFDALTQLEARSYMLSRVRALHHNELTRQIAVRAWTESFRQFLRQHRFDTIHIHNLHSAGWDIEVVETCLEHAPVVWTLHDMWAITGSCAYAYDCKKYLATCDAHCPEASSYPTLPGSMISSAHLRRRQFFSTATGLTVVAPSQWLANCARSALPHRIPVRHVPNCLDRDIFRPASPLRSSAPGLPPRLLVVGTDLTDRRKGLGLLLKALKLLNHKVELLVLGADQTKIVELLAQSPSTVHLRALGFVRGDGGLAKAYQEAEILLHPALADNEPLVVREAMACGLPVVGFAVGGLSELVADAGWLAPVGDVEALAKQLATALRERDRWPEYRRKALRQAQERNAAVRTLAPYLMIYNENAS